MGYDIKIGRVYLKTTDQDIKDMNTGDMGTCFNYNLEIMPCEGEEPAGTTSPEWGFDSGSPKRSPSYTGWSQFMKSCPPLVAISEKIKPRSSDGCCYALNTDLVKKCIDDLEPLVPSLIQVDQDRAKWLIFWTREAVKRYGNDAAIGFW